MAPWDFGTLELWDFGALGDFATLGLRDLETLGLWDIETNRLKEGPRKPSSDVGTDPREALRRRRNRPQEGLGSPQATSLISNLLVVNSKYQLYIVKSNTGYWKLRPV